MFKDKFKKLVSSSDFKNVDFEIIKETQASSIIGGCNTLQYCNVFTGSCESSLSKCNTFKEKSKMTEDFESLS